MTERIFGSIEGHAVGETFSDRKALAKAGLYKPLPVSRTTGPWSESTEVSIFTQTTRLMSKMLDTIGRIFSCLSESYCRQTSVRRSFLWGRNRGA